MKHLLEIIKQNGYKPFGMSCTFKDQNADAAIQNKMLFKRDDIIFLEGSRTTEESRFIFPKKENELSSMLVGGLSVRWYKEDDYDNPIIWGLSEYEKPPTLTYPRPNIKREVFSVNRKYLYNESQDRDDSMIHCLRVEKHEDIFIAMFDDSICFEYPVKK